MWPLKPKIFTKKNMVHPKFSNIYYPLRKHLLEELSIVIIA